MKDATRAEIVRLMLAETRLRASWDNGQRNAHAERIVGLLPNGFTTIEEDTQAYFQWTNDEARPHTTEYFDILEERFWNDEARPHTTEYFDILEERFWLRTD